MTSPPALVASADHLQALSAERVRDELMKVLIAAKPSAALDLYATSGVLRSLYPELENCRSKTDNEDGAWRATMQACDSVSRRVPVVRLAALFHAVGWCGERTIGEANDADAGRSAAIARSALSRRRSRFQRAGIQAGGLGRWRRTHCMWTLPQLPRGTPSPVHEYTGCRREPRWRLCRVPLYPGEQCSPRRSGYFPRRSIVL